MSDCAACDRFIQSTWEYCPHCGASQTGADTTDSVADDTADIAADGGHASEEDTSEEPTGSVGNAATGIDLFDEPLEIERGFVQIAGAENSVDHEHRVRYDHDPPVEFDARFFGVKTELSVDFEWAGYRGRALANVPNEELRAFIEAVAPHLGLSVERDEEPIPDGGTADLPPPRDGADPWCTWCDTDLEDEVWMIEGRDDSRWPSAFCSESCAREWGCAADQDRVYRVEDADEVVAR